MRLIEQLSIPRGLILDSLQTQGDLITSLLHTLYLKEILATLRAMKHFKVITRTAHLQQRMTPAGLCLHLLLTSDNNSSN